ncbi:MAG: hypothetical protein B6D64_04295 [Bacteroidetes bacterium 4484_276]|nr:MAG: hypothetical protein B6D64_04295 [Bacteroidetes bacterium 4484_276]OYT12901.1 MAG: energy transducer TonB [Bacteroidetes bacterium 4572_114]
MRDTKNKSSALERKKFIFLEIGMIVALAAVIMAFNHRSLRNSSTVIYERLHDKTTDQLIPVTIQPNKPPPAPPPPTTQFNIVVDGTDIETDYKIDVEADEKTKVANYVPFVPDEETLPEPKLPYNLDKLPDFPGGEIARLQFLRDNLKFPQSAVEIGASGTVYIQFVIEPDGSITNIEAVRGPGVGLNEEAVRVAGMMPRWKPGMQRGRAVRVLFTMPIKFVLQ